MGVSVHGHANKRRDVDAEKHLKRLHKTIPLIETPLTGADNHNLVFSQRHEANAVELFFDLFFAANLATFTTYHSVTNTTYLVAYIGFFGILWSCWFQCTLHDVRFARDSLYERICKLVQFIVFVGLALVGSGFNPGGKNPNNRNFRILCYTLVLSRVLFIVQYFVVLYYIKRARYSKLYLPLTLHIIIYSIAAIAFGAMTPAFRTNQDISWIYVIWYIIMFVEAVGVITISCVWKMLSFKRTHLMERMSLLTLIVIGEGAIGVTKTVSRLMGTGGLDVESCALVICIIAVLVLLWALYFDNFPHGHYGTIRQQIWSLLHFPFQLAIVGVVEGSQQIALARYVNRNYHRIQNSIVQYCYVENRNGVELRDRLLALLNYFQFSSKVETEKFPPLVSSYIYNAANQTNICSPSNATTYLSTGEWPTEFYNMTYTMFDGVYQGLGMKIPTYRLRDTRGSRIATDSWKTVYVYYWVSFCILMACSTTFLFLIRRHRVDLFDFVSVVVRILAFTVGVTFVALVANDGTLFKLIASPALLPTCMSLLIIVLFFDRISATFSNMRLLKSGQPYAHEFHDHSHHHHHDNHGSPELDPMCEPLVSGPAKMGVTAWSMESDTTTMQSMNHMNADTAYQPPQPYDPISSPPLGPSTPNMHPSTSVPQTPDLRPAALFSAPPTPDLRPSAPATPSLRPSAPPSPNLMPSVMSPPLPPQAYEMQPLMTPPQPARSPSPSIVYVPVDVQHYARHIRSDSSISQRYRSNSNLSATGRLRSDSAGRFRSDSNV